MTTLTAPPPPLNRPSLNQRISRALLPVYTALAVAYLFLPIAVMIAFSFNDPRGRQNITWQGFTLDNYLTIWGRPDIIEPMLRSLAVAVISTLIATTLGTLIGLALTRYDFRGRGPLNLFIFLPMATPEIIMGASLLAMFVSVGVARDMTTIVIAHVMFNISYVTVTVRARLAGFNRTLEEAAMDLGADEWTTFRKVTLPLIFPRWGANPIRPSAGLRLVAGVQRLCLVLGDVAGHLVRGRPAALGLDLRLVGRGARLARRLAGHLLRGLGAGLVGALLEDALLVLAGPGEIAIGHVVPPGPVSWLSAHRPGECTWRARRAGISP